MASTGKPTLASRVRVNDDVLFQALQGEAVLLNLKAGVYFGLDAVGTRIWQLFAEHNLLSEIAQVIVTEYEVAEDRCAADLLALIADLEHDGLVSVTSQNCSSSESSLGNLVEIRRAPG